MVSIYSMMSCVQLFTCHDHLLFTVNDPMYHDTFVLANFYSNSS